MIVRPPADALLGVGVLCLRPLSPAGYPKPATLDNSQSICISGPVSVFVSVMVHVSILKRDPPLSTQQ